MKIKNNIYKIIIFIFLMLAIVLNLSVLYDLFKKILNILNPVFIGMFLAFILNVPMKRIEYFFEKNKLKILRRQLAILCTLILVLLIILLCILIIIPNLTNTFSALVLVGKNSYVQIEKFLINSDINPDLLKLLFKQLNDFISMDKIVAILSHISLNAGSIFSNFFSLFLSIIFMINFLASKEHLYSIFIKAMRAFFGDKITNNIIYIVKISVETYDRYLLTKIIDAFIIGIMISVAYTICGLPYGIMIGILAAVLSFIPYVGSLTALLIGFLFIFVESPMKAFISIIVFQSMQLIEDNIIYPRLVGKSVGLPTIFTLVAAVIGGGLFGFLGMIFFTPIFAVIYRLLKEFVNNKIDKKNNLL